MPEQAAGCGPEQPATPRIMGAMAREIPDWDEYYLNICQVVAARSKDPNTQIGCVIVGPAHEIRSTGYNSFPRGIRDDVPERLVRPAKYLWIEHAERNAICNAARAGTATEKCTLYVEIMPCMDCAREILINYQILVFLV
jgi:dCMP deaminase